MRASATRHALTSPDGSQMGITLPFCVPDQLGDRCSSSSDNGPSSGAGGWSSDFGLADDIAWPQSPAARITSALRTAVSARRRPTLLGAS
jgi:hypothetical protein